MWLQAMAVRSCDDTSQICADNPEAAVWPSGLKATDITESSLGTAFIDIDLHQKDLLRKAETLAQKRSEHGGRFSRTFSELKGVGL
jgi:hypothetical protein